MFFFLLFDRSLCLALFSRFGSGYTLTLRAVSAPPPQAKSKGPSDDPDSSSPSSGSEAVLKLKDLVAKTFPLAELKEEHYNQVQSIIKLFLIIIISLLSQIRQLRRQFQLY